MITDNQDEGSKKILLGPSLLLSMPWHVSP